MEQKESCPKLICDNCDTPIIYRPKPKKLCASYNILKSTNKNRKKDIKKHSPLTPKTSINFDFKNALKDNNLYKSKNISKLHLNKRPNLDFEEISLEEIENDFTKLKARSEVHKVEKELLYLLRNSTQDNSVDYEYNEITKIKRPKNPFLENLKES